MDGRREDFERWIADDIARIEQTVDDLLIGEGINARDVDSVFLTGGSSFIPAVRRIFAARFGDERLAEGHNFTASAENQVRSGLPAGGNWIRTFGSARDRLRFKALSLVGRLVVRRIEGADQ
jgi:hypothetical protein